MRLIHRIENGGFGRFVAGGRGAVTNYKIDGTPWAVVWDTETWSFKKLEPYAIHGQYYVALDQPKPGNSIVMLYRFRQPGLEVNWTSRFVRFFSLSRKPDEPSQMIRVVDAVSKEVMATFENVTDATFQKIAPDGQSILIEQYRKDDESTWALWDIRPHRPWGMIAAIWGAMLLPIILMRGYSMSPGDGGKENDGKGCE